MPVGPFSAVASSFSKFRRRYPEIEASNSQPGKYKFVVKNRKGFVKVALRNGSPSLVPIVSFAETDLFDQLVQEFTRKSLWVASVIINGRGFFQCSFGIIPRKQPVTTVGKIFVSTYSCCTTLIECFSSVEHTKIANPTNEQVEELHSKFVQSLITLFEEYKYKYLENPEDKYLELQ
jgi:2-acylglycerol O-acyltransferase 2